MKTSIYSFGPFHLDLTQQVLQRDGKSLPLKPKVFDVLAVLVQNSGRLICKEELMKQVWTDSFVEEGNLAVCIFEIRRALGSRKNGQRYIETVPRRGYRFVARVNEETRLLTVEEPERSGAFSSERSVALNEYPVLSKGSMAVLPFKFIGGEADEYLGLGMADALITRLSNLRHVAVRPTSSVRKYDGSVDSVLAGRELGVEWVLDGSVQKSRKRIRLTVQLISVVDGILIWADKFEEKFTDIFEVEDSVSQRVVSAMRQRLTGHEKSLLTKRYTQNADAYEAYLKGRYFLEKRTTEGCKKSIEYFEQAIALDPDYALAHAGVSGCYITLTTILPSQDCISLAESAALKALDLDRELVEAHVSLGYIHTRKWNWLSAENEFRAAIELNPNHAIAHATYAIYLAEVGRSSEAIVEIKSGHTLDPLSLTINSQLGSLLYLSGRYEEAAQQFRRTLELDPSFALTHFQIGYLWEVLGEYDEALKEYEISQSGLGNLAEFTACLGRIHALSGRRDQAFLAIDELKRLSAAHYVQPNLVALVYLALDDKDEAIRWLEQAYEERDEDLCLLKIDPRFNSLHGDPRFESLLRRVGLVQDIITTSSEPSS